MTSMNKIIEVIDLNIQYNGTEIVNDLSFGIEKGKFNTLIGSNGAGKSTVMRHLAGVEKPKSGTIKIFGEDPYDYDFSKRHEIFFIHENYQLDFGMPLIKMLKHYREIFPNWNNEEFNRLLKSRKFSINKNLSDLSRGQKMQFLLMMALASRPKILFLDEITSVIDIESQKFFLDELRDFCDLGGTVVLTTNILHEVNNYTDHLFLIQDKTFKVNSKSDDLKKEFVLIEDVGNSILPCKEIVFCGKTYDGIKRYIIRRDYLFSNQHIEKNLSKDVPRLEEILTYFFSLKEVEFNEELSA